MSTASFDLSDFLSQQQGDGQFDSVGSFTVAVQEARRKLARFSLPRETAWVAKLLQAAVGWRANELSLTSSANASCFRLRPSHRYGVPHADEILKAFLSGDLGRADPLSRLCLALMSLGEQTHLPFLLVLDHEHEPQIFDSGLLVREGGKLKPEHRFPGGIALTVSHIRADESKLRAFFFPARRAGRMYEMVRELYDQGPYCPMKLVYDSRPVNNWDPHRLYGEHTGGRPLLTLGLSVKTRKTRPWVRPFDFPQAYWPEAPSEKPVAIPISNEECDVVIRLWHEKTSVVKLGTRTATRTLAMSCLYWVVDGIVVGKVRFGLPSTVRLEILADASELPTDLTGMSVIDSTRSEASRIMVIGAVARELRTRQSELHRHAPSVSLCELIDTLEAQLRASAPPWLQI